MQGLREVPEYLARVDALYTMAGSPEEVAAGIQALLDHYAEQHGKDDIVYATLLNELGAFHRGRHQFREGEAAFYRAAEILRSFGEAYYPELATTLNNLAELYRMEGLLDQAEEQLKKSLEIFIDAENDQVVPYASALNYLGHIAMDRGQYMTAAEHYQRSCDLLTSTNAGGEGQAAMLKTGEENLAHALAAQQQAALRAQKPAPGKEADSPAPAEIGE